MIVLDATHLRRLAKVRKSWRDSIPYEDSKVKSEKLANWKKRECLSRKFGKRDYHYVVARVDS